MASGAEDVLAAARIVPTIADALAGVTWSVALTARMREYGPPQLAPREAASEARLHAPGGNIAFVFGNERTGLSNEHVERCSALAHIPANPAYSSLNLAQAVQVLAYELRIAYLAEDGAAAPPEADEASAGARAPSDDIERMYVHLENALIALEFLDPANPKKLMSQLAPALRSFRSGTRGGQYPSRHREAHLAQSPYPRRLVLVVARHCTRFRRKSAATRRLRPPMSLVSTGTIHARSARSVRCTYNRTIRDKQIAGTYIDAFAVTATAATTSMAAMVVIAAFTCR